MQSRLTVHPCSLAVARDAVARLHRHLPAPLGGRLAFEVRRDDGTPVGWLVLGRPSSRVLDARGVWEVTRVATDGTPNACSALYGAASRAARKAGATALVTYTLPDEPGTSLRAAGWLPAGWTKGGRWSCPARPDAADTVAVPKRRHAAPWSDLATLGRIRPAPVRFR